MIPLSLAGCLLVSGCGMLPGGGGVTLNLVAADYGTDEASSSALYWNKLARDFEAANSGVKVHVEVVGWPDIDKRIADLIAQGKTPDIVQTGGFADQVAADRLYPVGDVLSMESQANLLNSFNRAGQVLGSQYGIPFISSSRVFVYNKAIFDKAGISAPPTTWEELRKDAELIKSKVPGVTPYALPLGPEEAQAESMIWTMSGGGEISDSVGNYTIDSQPNRDTFKWLRTSLVDKGLTYDDPGKVNRQDAFGAFAKGQVAMLNGHPALLKSAAAAGIQYGTAPIPRRAKDVKEVTFGVADWLMAFKANGHRAEIKKFLNFTLSKQNTLKFDEQYNMLPVTQDTLDDMSANPAHQDLAQFLQNLPTADFYPYGEPSWDKVSSLIKQKIGGAVKPGADQVLGELQAAAAAEASKSRQG
ncbi:putative ABC transporter substrate-binding protein [Kitasatospora setae KM-6054]|uniref:Putative ABC transporter substrate-binding protein n=1 Tax=Kitasatospora setae (strain ATCC 33774 / DSM 43861 / JCM 3304 / KCC A-0304 / NBRC 14216 / KM-6054) TaxID=452652 RepID=E4NFA6_KITSK|nr:putative ABC transporter substrate-binding protein [Kitasatospora setae KM-6054]